MGGGFPPPAAIVPFAAGPDDPPPGGASSPGKGPLLAVVAVVVVLLGAVGFAALSGSDDKDDAPSNPTATTTGQPRGPSDKEGAAAEGQKGDVRPDDTSAPGAPKGYGDDGVLDALYDGCQSGDYQACDDLYLKSGFDTDYEAFGDTCGERNEPSGFCVALYGGDGSTGTIDGQGAMSYGDNVLLDGLYDECADGDFAACDTLYSQSDIGSEYQEFADSCGDRNEPSGYCVELYANGGG